MSGSILIKLIQARRYIVFALHYVYLLCLRGPHGRVVI